MRCVLFLFLNLLKFPRILIVDLNIPNDTARKWNDNLSNDSPHSRVALIGFTRLEPILIFLPA